MRDGCAGWNRRAFVKLCGAAPLFAVSAGTWIACGGDDGAPHDPYAEGEHADAADDPLVAAGDPEPAGSETGSEQDPSADPSPTTSADTKQEQEQEQEQEPDAEGDALVTEVAAMQSTVQALQYTNETDKPDQRCDGCQFYTATRADRGSCQLFTQGLVTAGGWCSSWTKKIEE